MVLGIVILLAGLFGQAPPPATYVGDEPCSICHESEFKSFRRTAMGRTISLPGENDILSKSSGSSEFYSPDVDRYYSIAKKGDHYYHRETQKDGKRAIIYSAERALSHSVGAGLNGWSYLISNGDRLYMERDSVISRAPRPIPGL